MYGWLRVCDVIQGDGVELFDSGEMWFWRKFEVVVVLRWWQISW